MMHHTGIVDALNFEIQEQSSHCEKHDKSKLTSRNHFYLALENNPYSLCDEAYTTILILVFIFTRQATWLFVMTITTDVSYICSIAHH